MAAVERNNGILQGIHRASGKQDKFLLLLRGILGACDRHETGLIAQQIITPGIYQAAKNIAVLRVDGGNPCSADVHRRPVEQDFLAFCREVHSVEIHTVGIVIRIRPTAIGKADCRRG